MEEKIIELLLEKWNTFCEIGGEFDCDLDCYKEPSSKSLKSFMEWLKWNK